MPARAQQLTFGLNGANIPLGLAAHSQTCRVWKDAQGADTVGAGARVLFVDDEEVLRTVTTQALAQRGFAVHSAEDGSAALGRFDADPSAIDAVVTDMSMPGLDGAELIRRLRERRPGLPAILCPG